MLDQNLQDLSDAMKYAYTSLVNFGRVMGKVISMNIALIAYLVNNTGNHNKDYLIIRDTVTNIYYSSWGAFGRDSLGTKEFHSGSEMNRLLDSKKRSGYIDKHITLQELLGSTHKSAKQRFDYIIKEHNIDPFKKTATATSLSLENVLKNLKRYLEFNPDDVIMMELAVQIGTVKNKRDVENLLEVKYRRPLEDERFINKIIHILSHIEQGENLILKYLKSLNKGLLDNAKISENERGFMRGLFKRPFYTLPQLYWLKSIAEKVDTYNAINLSPFI